MLTHLGGGTSPPLFICIFLVLSYIFVISKMKNHITVPESQLYFKKEIKCNITAGRKNIKILVVITGWLMGVFIMHFPNVLL